MPEILSTSLDPVATPSAAIPGLFEELQRERSRPPHILVEARAGTGKTFTIMAGVAYMYRTRVRGIWPELIKRVGFEPTPSKQQLAIWDSMALSADASSVQMTAFNKVIVKEFEDKWSWLVALLGRNRINLKFATNHSMGLAAVRKRFKVDVEPDRVAEIICLIEGVDMYTMRRSYFEILKYTERLVGLAKMNMLGHDKQIDEDDLDALVNHHDLDLPSRYRGRVYDLVPKVLELCKDPVRDGCVDYNDMVWLPCELDLPVPTTDILLVDECQDLNRCQQHLACRAGQRIVMVGDPKQAIYGFAGADAATHVNVRRTLEAAPNGCVVMPLTYTRRCGREIVAEANTIVSDFYAYSTNCEGKVSTARYPTVSNGGSTRQVPWDQCYLSSVRPGDFILCRVNAPLVSNCFRLLERGIRTTIQGRDIAGNLISTIENLEATSIDDLVGKVTVWLAREMAKERAKRIPSEARMIAIQDRANCIVCFTDGQTSVEGVKRRIDALFTDNTQGEGVRMSSIHRAKGLEAKRVFLLRPPGADIPHPSARTRWQIEQEYNLLYVAITRAIEELVYVTEAG